MTDAAPRRLTGEDYARLRLDEGLIVAAVKRHFPDLEKHGYRYTVRTGDDGSSVSVFFDQGRNAWKFHRFSLGQHGDVFDVLKWYDGIEDPAEALEFLGRTGGAPAEPHERLTPPPPEEEPEWIREAPLLVARYERHPDKFDLWREYKPFGAHTIERWRLGVGVVPKTPCRHNRLIYPVYHDGRIVAVRGRHIGCGCPAKDKWLSAGGTHAQLWGWDLLRVGSEPETVVVPENPADAMLGMQEVDGCVAVAGTAGAGTWRAWWTERILNARPKCVLLWFDNDLAGSPNAETLPAVLEQWRQKWHAKHPDLPTPKDPVPNGYRIVDHIRRRVVERGDRVSVDYYDWPRGTPIGADLGWALAKNLRRVA